MRVQRASGVCGVLLVSLWITGGAIAAGKKPLKPEPWQTISANLLQVQNSIASVDRMVDRDMRGFDSASGGTWLEQCCSYNIRKVREGTAGLRASVDYLESQYSEKGDLDSIKKLPVVRKHLDEIEGLFQNVGLARGKQEAQSRLEDLIHPLSHVRQALAELEACCAVDPPPSADAP